MNFLESNKWQVVGNDAPKYGKMKKMARIHLNVRGAGSELGDRSL